MKLFVVDGMLRCGHLVYRLKKYIIARSKSEARDTYKIEHPNAKITAVMYEYDVSRAYGPYVIAQEFIKN